MSDVVQIIYTGPVDAVTVGGQVAERDGKPVDVSAELAAELVARGDWKHAAKPTRKQRT